MKGSTHNSIIAARINRKPTSSHLVTHLISDTNRVVFNTHPQLQEQGSAYQCGKVRASDLILEVNGKSTVDMTHDEIARTIAAAYYQNDCPYIEFLIGESVQAS